MIDIFIAYSHKDVEYKDELKKFLYPHIRGRQEQVNLWDNFSLEPGEDWDNSIQKKLESADIILLLVSVDALNSDYFYNREAEIALERHNKKEAIAIPIILRRCGWTKTPIKDLEVLPEKGLPIAEWQNRDHAWDDTVNKLGKVIDKVELKKKNETLEAEIRVKFNASIQSGQQLLGKENWKEAKVAFSNALSMYKIGFEPAKADIQTWIKECTDAMKKIEDEIRRERAEKDRIKEDKIREKENLRKRKEAEAILKQEAIALQQRLDQERSQKEEKQKIDEDARNAKKAAEDLLIKQPQPSPVPAPPKKEEAPKAQPYDASVSVPQKAVKNGTKKTDSDNIFGALLIMILGLLIFSLHYSLRIKYFEYVTLYGHWTTCIILSLISTALLGLVAWASFAMLDSKKYKPLGSLFIIVSIFFLLYGFYKPIYTYYAFDTGLLIKPQSSLMSQENGANTNSALTSATQPDSVSKSISQQHQDTIADTPEQILQKLGVEMVALSSKRYYITVDSDNTLASCVEVLKKMKDALPPGQVLGYVGYCQTNVDKYYVLADSRDYYNNSLAMNAAKKIKRFKVAVSTPCK
jgi:TIR domain